MPTSRRFPFSYALTFTALVFLAKAIYLSLTTVRGLGTTSWLIDDTFIIMRIARNIAQGYGFTVDFTHVTTGAPPLWTYLTSLNHLVFPLDWAVKATLIETTLLGSAAAYVTYLIAKKISLSERVAWVALILATFAANGFFEAMNGMDTSLFTLMVMLTVACHLGVGPAGKMNGTTRASWTGILAGITTLVRGDGLFLIGVIGLAYVVRWVRHKHNRAATQKALLAFAVCAGVFIAVLIGWNLINSGSPQLANQVGRREMAMSAQGFDYAHFTWGQYLKIVIWSAFQLERLISIAAGSSLLVLLGLLYGLKRGHTAALSALTIVYSSTFFLLLVTYQWYFPDLHGLRYVNPAVHLFFILIAALLVDLLGDWKKYSKLALTIACAAIIVLSFITFRDMIIHLTWYPGTTMTGFPTKEQEVNKWKMVDWINANLPEDAVIGIRDYGRESLYTNRPVQDLSGNTDPMVPKLAREGSGLAEYLNSRNVQYLLIPALDQRKDLIYQVLHRDLKLVEVKGAPVETTRHLYKIDWARTPLKKT